MKGMVVAPQPQAVEVGAEILRLGGNAVDAALATAFAQGVVDPHMCGIGGFGVMLISTPRNPRGEVIEFYGRAGSRATPDMFVADLVGRVRGHAERYEVRGYVNQIGYRSVVVPGVVAGFEMAHSRHGSLDWATLLKPAIRLAEEGIEVSGELYDSWTRTPQPGHVDGFTRLTATPASRDIYTVNGRLYRPGERLVQSDYAKTLRAIADGGAEVFYRGWIAERIADDFSRNGGLITLQDLADYQAEVTRPVEGTYRGRQIRSVGPPGSGIQVIEILNMLEQFDLTGMRQDSAEYVALASRIMQASFVDRARFLGDPHFTNVPIEMLCSKEYARERCRKLEGVESELDEVLRPDVAEHTTHVCTLDEEGNCVSLTHTLGSASGVVVPGLGFTFNNCMYQFNPIPGHANSIAPGKSRITGAAPTVVYTDGEVSLVVGGLGGTRILTGVVHCIVNMFDFGMSVVEAVSAPRFQAETQEVDIEPRLYYRVRKDLEEKGFALRRADRSYDRSFAVVVAIAKDRSGRFLGGADPRGGGGVAEV